MSDVEDTIRHLMSKKGCHAVVVMDHLGRAIRSTLDDENTMRHCQLLLQLAQKTKTVVDELDSSNELTFLRVTTKKCEIMLIPDPEYYLFAITERSGSD